MNTVSTFGELFRFEDWGRDQLLDAASKLTDEQLDQKFEIGCGTLRSTLIHLHEAQLWWVWMCMGEEAAEPPTYEPLDPLVSRWRETTKRRDAFISRCDDSVMARAVQFEDGAGSQRSHPVSDVLLHVVNHGVHHRSQANNILRQLGMAPLRVDYIFMKSHAPSRAPLSVKIIQDWYAYEDWAQIKVLESAKPLLHDELDRPFDMGMGTFRKTLAHINAAQEWWFQNWTAAADRLFPEKETTASVPELIAQNLEIASARNAFLEKLHDDELDIKAQPREGFFASFPLGQTMIQLCVHGTLHRAQALNMLRHLGAAPLRMDYLRFAKERQDSA